MQTRPDGERAEAWPAAVALILAGSPLDLLLIRRSESPLDPWSGHMALPGGRLDPSDVDSVSTAIRETLEEVGVALDRSTYRASLSPLEARGRGLKRTFPVIAHVFRLPERPVTTPNHEVAEVLWAPLYALEVTPVLLDNGRGPGLNLDGRIVWGLTYRIVASFLKNPKNFQDM